MDFKNRVLSGTLRGEVSRMHISKSGGVYSFKGVATQTSLVDRMRRVFLPGAFGQIPAQVPLLAFHDDTHPVGVSKLIQKGEVILHQSSLLDIAYAKELETLIEGGAIPATSIGWSSQEVYWGVADLISAKPELVELLQKSNIPLAENIIYFAQAEILENSLTPIPANPLALISVASMVSPDERGMVDSMIALQKADVEEKAKSALQKAHDDLVSAGAVCVHTAAQGEDLDDDVNLLVATIDAALDQALNLHMDGQDDSAWLLVLAADQAVDHLLEVLNLPDNDEAPEGTPVPLSEQAKLRLEEFKAAAAAVWSTSYVNNLPDSAFAYIAEGGKKDADGKTTPRSLRYFPHHSTDGAPDEAHVRNALARIPQAKIPASAKSEAESHVEAHAKKLGIDTGEDASAETAETAAPGIKHTHAKAGGGTSTHTHENAVKGHSHDGLLPLPKDAAEGEEEASSTDALAELGEELAALEIGLVH